MGVPRTVCPEDDELKELGEEMLAWVNENNPLHIREWWLIHKDITEKSWDVMCQKDIFLHYYNKALSVVAKNYIDKDSQVPDSIKNRFLRMYFKDLRDEEDEKKRTEIRMRVEAVKDIGVDQQTAVQFMAENFGHSKRTSSSK